MDTPSPLDGLPARYHPERVVGAGGFGAVIRAQDSELGRLVAIKRLHPHLADDEALARLRREAQRTAELRHPHVIEVLDLGEDDEGLPFLVYEWVEGRDLQAFVAAGKVPPPATLRRWGAAIARALQVAHEAGVVHRDVKPANVLLREDGHVLLADLGIAQVAGGNTVHTAEGLILGTLSYMAPELLRGEPASPASDQFAWAASLRELAGGGPLWGSGDPSEVLRASRRPRTFALPDGLARDAPDLATTLERALAWEPEDRFADMARLAGALEGEGGAPPPRQAAPRQAPTVQVPRTGTARGEDSAAPATAHLDAPAPPTPRPRWPLAAAAVAALALGLVARARRSPDPPPSTAPPPPAALHDTPTAQALVAAQEELLADLHIQDGAWVSDPGHHDRVARSLLEEPRILFRWRRLLRRTQAWLEEFPGDWTELRPAGDLDAWERLRMRAIGPLEHWLGDLFRVRHMAERLAPTTRMFRRHDRLLAALEEHVLAFEDFLEALGPAPPRSAARATLEASTVSFYLADMVKDPAASARIRDRRLSLLERLRELLGEATEPLDRIELSLAAGDLMDRLSSRERIPPETWDAVLEHLAQGLATARQADSLQARRSTVVVATSVVGLAARGTRTLGLRPASPRALAATDVALAYLEEHGAENPDSVAKLRGYLGGIRADPHFVLDGAFAPRLERALALGTSAELRALRQSRAPLLAHHRAPRDEWRLDDAHHAAVARELVEERRTPLRWSRFLRHVEAWLASLPGDWRSYRTTGPEGERHAQIWNEVVRPMLHFLSDLGHLRRCAREIPPEPPLDSLKLSERLVLANADAELLQELQSFLRRLLPPDAPPGAPTGLAVETALSGTFGSDDLPASRGGDPQGVVQRQNALLGQVAAYLEEAPAGADAVAVGRAARYLMFRLGIGDSVSQASWDRVLSGLTRAAITPGPPSRSADLPTRLELAGGVVQLAAKGTRTMLRPASPAALEAARDATAFVESHPEVPVSDLRTTRAWILDQMDDPTYQLTEEHRELHRRFVEAIRER